MLYSIGWYDPQENLHFVEDFDNGTDGELVQHADSMRKAGFVLDGVENLDGSSDELNMDDPEVVDLADEYSSLLLAEMEV